MLGSGVPVSLFKQQADHHILAMTTIRLGQTIVNPVNDPLAHLRVRTSPA